MHCQEQQDTTLHKSTLAQHATVQQSQARSQWQFYVFNEPTPPQQEPGNVAQQKPKSHPQMRFLSSNGH